MVDHIDGFENSALYVDFAAQLVDDSGEQGEIEVVERAVAYDVYKESAADFVAAKRK